MELLQFADSIDGFAEIQDEVLIDDSSDLDLKAEIEALRIEVRQLNREAKKVNNIRAGCVVSG